MQLLTDTNNPLAAAARGQGRARLWLAWLFLLGTIVFSPQYCRAASYAEDAVKAAFLYRFTAYVEWPSATPAARPFRIAVIGADGVARQLERLLQGKSVQGRRAEVVTARSTEELGETQILYIAPGAAARETALLAAATAQPILIVTDEEDGFRIGGIINFLPVGENLRFEVSLTAAARSQLKINSGLLSVAARVEGRPRAHILCPSGSVEALGRFGCGAEFADASRPTPRDSGLTPLVALRSRPRCRICS